MTLPRDEYLLRRAEQVMNAKQHDYTGGNADRLIAFRQIADLAGLTLGQVWAVFFLKHVTAVTQWAQGRQPEGEQVMERLVDIINYARFAALIDEEDS